MPSSEHSRRRRRARVERSTPRGPTALSPAMFDPRPQHWDGERWVLWVEPERPPSSPRRRLATAGGLIALPLLAVTLLVPSLGFALYQWLAIALVVASVVLFLRRERDRAVAKHLIGRPLRRGTRTARREEPGPGT